MEARVRTVEAELKDVREGSARIRSFRVSRNKSTQQLRRAEEQRALANAKAEELDTARKEARGLRGELDTARKLAEANEQEARGLRGELDATRRACRSGRSGDPLAAKINIVAVNCTLANSQNRI